MNTSTPPRDAAARWRIPSWVGDVAAVAVVIVVSAMPGPRPPMPHFGLASLVPVLIVVALVLVPLRRRWPLPVLAASLALYCITALVGTASTGIGIVAVIAAYSVGARTSRLVTLVAGGIAAAVVVLLSVTVSNFGVVEPRVFQVAAGIAVAAALGDSSRSHREYIVAANERAERAEQTREAEAQQRVAEERLRIAQDLHDTVAHQISVISLNAGAASNALDRNPEKVRAALGTIRTSSREVLAEIGKLLRYLRTDAAPGGGSGPGTQPLYGVNEIDALVTRMTKSGLRVELTREGDLGRVGGLLGQTVYRVVQEGLTNAHKHGSGRASTVEIALRGDEVTVTISNPVDAGTRNQPEPPRGGLGLTGIRERVASLGGTVHVDASGGRFVLTASLPIEPAQPGLPAQYDREELA